MFNIPHPPSRAIHIDHSGQVIASYTVGSPASTEQKVRTQDYQLVTWHSHPLYSVGQKCGEFKILPGGVF